MPTSHGDTGRCRRNGDSGVLRKVWDVAPGIDIESVAHLTNRKYIDEDSWW